jgi:iron(III) transport system ATP-binding protein
MTAAAAPLAAEPVVVDRVTKRFGATEVLRGVSLDVEPGAVVVLLGPSGCGKTTLLRVIAGLEVPDAGTVRVGDRVLTGPGELVSPERRRVGMVFQEWALFPHLSVARNVAYGLPRSADGASRVTEALDLVDLAGLGDRMPATLSGGQQQRVALARALAPQPSVLLLDEPFSNLDTALRQQVRGELHALLADLGITTVVVTHDQEEAFVLGDEVAVVHDGRVVQQAPPAEIYAHPADAWVAGFVGDANLLVGSVVGGVADTAVGPVPVVPGPQAGARLQGPAQVLVRPEELDLAPESHLTGAGAPVTGRRAVVDLVEFHGHDTMYLVHLDDGTELRVRRASAPVAWRGDAVAVRYTGDGATAFPPAVAAPAPIPAAP